VPDPTPPEFAVIGEAILDLTAPADDGASIARPGGSPMNVAIGLARLGQPTAFVGRMSDDPIGTVLRRHLERSLVDLRHVVRATEPSTTGSSSCLRARRATSSRCAERTFIGLPAS
jgi:fructokinase